MKRTSGVAFGGDGGPSKRSCIPEANIDLALERGFDQSMKRTELIKELLGEKEELLRKNQIQRVEIKQLKAKIGEMKKNQATAKTLEILSGKKQKISSVNKTASSDDPQRQIDHLKKMIKTEQDKHKQEIKKITKKKDNKEIKKALIRECKNLQAETLELKKENALAFNKLISYETMKDDVQQIKNHCEERIKAVCTAIINFLKNQGLGLDDTAERALKRFMSIKESEIDAKSKDLNTKQYWWQEEKPLTSRFGNTVVPIRDDIYDDTINKPSFKNHLKEMVTNAEFAIEKFLKEHGGTFTCHPVHCGSHSWLTGYEIRLEFPKKAGSKALSFRSHVYSIKDSELMARWLVCQQAAHLLTQGTWLQRHNEPSNKFDIPTLTDMEEYWKQAALEKSIDERNIRRFTALEKRNEEIQAKREIAKTALEQLEDFVGEYKEQDFKLLYNHPANETYQSGKSHVKSTDIITFKDIVKQRESLPVRYKKISADRSSRKEKQYLCQFEGSFGDLWISETNLKHANAQKYINMFQKREATAQVKRERTNKEYR